MQDNYIGRKEDNNYAKGRKEKGYTAMQGQYNIIGGNILSLPCIVQKAVSSSILFCKSRELQNSFFVLKNPTRRKNSYTPRVMVPYTMKMEGNLNL